MESVRTIIALAAQHGLRLHQVGIATAFLNGLLEEEVYMRQPEGFVETGREHLVCKLKQSLYGLKQSPRCWLDQYLKQLGFVIGVHVDDIILCGKSVDRISKVIHSLGDKFAVKDMGELHSFLGMKVIQKQETGDVWIGQQAYVDSVLLRFGQQDSKPVSTPVDTSSKTTDTDECVDKTGSLLYVYCDKTRHHLYCKQCG